MTLVKLPKHFFDDHRERDCETPVVVKETARHYHVELSDPALIDLYQDAEMYSLHGGQYTPSGVARSAEATFNALFPHFEN